jgi:hypothetical protein
MEIEIPENFPTLSPTERKNIVNQALRRHHKIALLPGAVEMDGGPHQIQVGASLYRYKDKAEGQQTKNHQQVEQWRRALENNGLTPREIDLAFPGGMPREPGRRTRRR